VGGGVGVARGQLDPARGEGDPLPVGADGVVVQDLGQAGARASGVDEDGGADRADALGLEPGRVVVAAEQRGAGAPLLQLGPVPAAQGVQRATTGDLDGLGGAGARVALPPGLVEADLGPVGAADHDRVVAEGGVAQHARRAGRDCGDQLVRGDELPRAGGRVERLGQQALAPVRLAGGADGEGEGGRGAPPVAALGGTSAEPDDLLDGGLVDERAAAQHVPGPLEVVLRDGGCPSMGRLTSGERHRLDDGGREHGRHGGDAHAVAVVDQPHRRAADGVVDRRGGVGLARQSG